MQKTKPALNVITAAQAGNSYLILGKDAVIQGSGGFSFACGGCGKILLDNLEAGQINNVILLCEVCGAFNGVTDADYVIESVV